MASRTRVPRSAASTREFPSTIRAVKYKILVIDFTVVFVSGSRVACRLRCMECAARVEMAGVKNGTWGLILVNEFGTLARTLIHIDNDATGAVHDEVSSPSDLRAGIAMPGEQKWTREKGRP